MEPSPSSAPPSTPFKPRKLERHALDVQVGPTMREMPARMRDEIVQREQDLARRFDLDSPRNVRRLRHYVLGSVVGIPLLNWLFTPIGFGALWIQLPLAAAFGALMALFSFRGAAAGFLLVGTGLLTLLLSGHRVGFSIATVFLFAAYFAIGLALGVSESLSADERS